MGKIHQEFIITRRALDQRMAVWLIRSAEEMDTKGDIAAVVDDETREVHCCRSTNKTSYAAFRRVVQAATNSNDPTDEMSLV